MPDDQVQFKSPTTGKVQAVPSENWDDALKQGYIPTTHKVMYSPDGKRGMVPNEDLRDYMKQGYQTTPKTQFESNVTGEGISLKGAGGAALQTIKGMIPSAPEGGTVNPLNPDFFTKKNLVGSPSMDFSKGTLAQGGQEAAAEYSRARAAGTNPVAAGYSAAISGAGPLVGVSDLAQQELAAKGEGGQIIGQSAVPAALALLPFASEGMKAAGVPSKVATALRTEGGTGAIKPGVHAASRLAGTGLGHLIGVPGLGEFGGFMFGPEAAESIIPKKGMPPPPPEFPGASLPSAEDFYANRGEELEAARKLDEKTRKASARKGGMVPPPDPFAGMTSSAAPIGNAPLPEVPQGSPTPFPPVQPKVAKAAAAGASPETSLLSRGRTLVEPGAEPDLNNPTHVKMINDYQTMSGPKLRELAGAGDRFAAFVLRHMPRP